MHRFEGEKLQIRYKTGILEVSDALTRYEFFDQFIFYTKYMIKLFIYVKRRSFFCPQLKTIMFLYTSEVINFFILKNNSNSY